MRFLRESKQARYWEATRLFFIYRRMIYMKTNKGLTIPVLEAYRICPRA